MTASITYTIQHSVAVVDTTCDEGMDKSAQGISCHRSANWAQLSTMGHFTSPENLFDIAVGTMGSAITGAACWCCGGGRREIFRDCHSRTTDLSVRRSLRSPEMSHCRHTVEAIYMYHRRSLSLTHTHTHTPPAFCTDSAICTNHTSEVHSAGVKNTALL